ncbi:MAG: endonuclease MutS2 [Acidobacteria bacterium]|nr:endonuclease MutS2 [Acidobacteriota bacterium]
MNSEALGALEFGALRETLARHTQSPLGRAIALGVEPSTGRVAIRRALGRTTEASRFLNERGRFGLGGLADPGPLMDRLRVAGAVLDAPELLDVANYIQCAIELRAAFSGHEAEYPLLSDVALAMPDLGKSLREIREKILPTGEVNEAASAELRRIRREIQRLRAEVQRSLEGLIRERASDAIQDEVITIRNGRFVVPVRAEFQKKVKGVLHGSSSTGQTVYIEPLDTIDQNNELGALREREESEIAKILAALTDRLRLERPGLERVVDGLGELDFCAAKAHLSKSFDCVEPALSEEGALELEGARHLLLESNLRDCGGRIVPMSISLAAERRVLVISGPNAGGKTVVLKTVGLCALMMQSGLHVPAKSAVLPVFEDVLVDIGDHQSLAANLSTFSAHVRNIASMLDSLPSSVLVLLDEIGTGTDPDEGAALAIAVLERLRVAGAFACATTHYNRLKIYASNTEGVGNAAVEFNEETLEPTFRLLSGLAGSSSGIEIAKRLGMPSDVAAAATGLMRDTDREAAEYLKRLKAATDEAAQLRAALDEEREAVATRYTELDLEFQKRERQRADEFAKVLETAVRDFEAEAKRFVSRTADRVEQARLRKSSEATAARMRSEARSQVAAVRRSSPVAAPVAGSGISEEAAQREIGPIEPGVDVLVAKLGQRGTVESIDGDRVEVRMGMLKMRVGRSEVERVARGTDGPAATRLPAGVSVQLDSDDMVPMELNLIGRHTDEAVDMLDKFLDAAFLGSLSGIRVIHGFGTGALRRAVADVLKRHPHVASFAPAPSNQGGGGATLVELRR